MKNLVLLILLCGLMAVTVSLTQAQQTISFTAGDIKNAMGIPLHDAQYQWGLWAVRVMPIGITGGSYAVVPGSGMINQPGWGVTAPSWYSWAGYGANIAWFWDASGAEVPGNPPNPLYMIMDRPANTFTSYYGNIVTAVNDASLFSFNFGLDPGATWNGSWQFLVDGSKYTLGTVGSPGVWVQDFFGNYGNGGGLSGNMGNGYVVPEPGTILLLGSGFLGLGFIGYFRRKRA